jgi:hypothetical protein
MPTLEQAVDDLRGLFDLERQAKEARARALQSIGRMNPARQDEIDKKLSEQVKEWEKNIRGALDELLRLPPFHSRHADKMGEFYQACLDYDKCVFVMTKYPEGHDPIDLELKRVIDSVVSSIRDCGYHPMLATDKQYHPILWDNVELYLVGCSKGVAIVEDRYKPELNPNVAIEWGWMRGMGKQILFLMEQGFRHNRADWDGFIRDDFIWSDPETSIPPTIQKWLKK